MIYLAAFVFLVACGAFIDHVVALAIDGGLDRVPRWAIITARLLLVLLVLVPLALIFTLVEF